MSLSAGTRIGPYEIVGLVGEGGMGEVYRARDAKLNRDVALKVLPEALAGDPDRLARFQREAQVLGALNHPNIAHIHGFEDASGTHAIVMELVEGPTLADRIARLRAPGASARQAGMALDEALPIARQVAEALEAAHELAIIHRDLKPANIKVRDDGVVKVLDFGLAKALDSGTSVSGTATNSPTLTAHATQMGTILGTAAYMAPEQAKGRTVDRRADIWAFGVVVFEMLTAERCFKGDDIADTLAAVLRQDVNWAALPAGTPPRLKRLLERCLDRDPKQRLRDIGEARVEIAKIEAGAPEASVTIAAGVVSTPAPAPRAIVPWVVAGATAIALVASVVTWAPWRTAPTAQPMRLSIVPPDTLPLRSSANERSMAISPDGMHVAYVTAEGGLVVRAIDHLEAEPIAGITGARQPFFSPDGKWIGFAQGTAELRKVSIAGGPAVTICKLSTPPRGASWGPDDTIVFATASGSGLFSVPAGGGQEPTLLTESVGRNGSHLFPAWLPGGRAVLFTIAGGENAGMQVAVLDVATGRHKVLIRGGSQAEYVTPGYLVYGVVGTLHAIRFDLQSLEVQGDPVPVVDQVTTGSNGSVQFAVSEAGALTYLPGEYSDRDNLKSLVWFDRKGLEEPSKAPLRDYGAIRLSPDGTRLATQINALPGSDIWVWHFKDETLTRLTLDGAFNSLPVWTPDGQRIVFRSNRAGPPAQAFWQAANGTGTAEQLATGTVQIYPSAFAGANRLLLWEGPPGGNTDLAMMTIDKREKTPLVVTPSAELHPTVSPDGRFMAYRSLEAGMPQVFVTTFPDASAGRWQISTDGGAKPLWSHDGKELFYERPVSRLVAGPGQAPNELYAMTVATTPAFSRGNPVKLFDLSGDGNAPGRQWDVSRDGKRFITVKRAPAPASSPGADQQSFVFIVNWVEELAAKLPR